MYIRSFSGFFMQGIVLNKINSKPLHMSAIIETLYTKQKSSFLKILRRIKSYLKNAFLTFLTRKKNFFNDISECFRSLKTCCILKLSNWKLVHLINTERIRRSAANCVSFS